MFATFLDIVTHIDTSSFKSSSKTKDTAGRMFRSGMTLIFWDLLTIPLALANATEDTQNFLVMVSCWVAAILFF